MQTQAAQSELTVCPRCERPLESPREVCPTCGTQLSYLVRHPLRARNVMWLCMLIGMGLMSVLLGTLVAQYVEGEMPRLTAMGRWQLGLGILFSILGVRAWVQLGDFVVAQIKTRVARRAALGPKVRT